MTCVKDEKKVKRWNAISGERFIIEVLTFGLAEVNLVNEDKQQDELMAEVLAVRWREILLSVRFISTVL